MSTAWPQTAVVLAAAYLLGSIPFSLLVARRYGVSDVRKVGSGNVGATNVLRSAGRRAGAIAFLLDAAKGAAAVLLARLLAPGAALEAQSALAAILGHVFPVWLSFRGGKGVATGVGAFAPLAPWAAAAGLAMFASLLWLTRYVAIASIGGGLALAATAWLLGAARSVAAAATAVALLIEWAHRSDLQRLALLGAARSVAAAATAVALLIVWTHRSNLQRLAAGSEARIGAKS